MEDKNIGNGKFRKLEGERERERGDTRIKGCSVVFRLLPLLLLLLGRESKHRKDRNCFSERSAAPPDESLKIYPKFHVRPIFARTDWPRTGYISGDAGCIVLKPCDPSALPPPPSRWAMWTWTFYCWKVSLSLSPLDSPRLRPLYNAPFVPLERREKERRGGGKK